jgi:hypothetical protein
MAQRMMANRVYTGQKDVKLPNVVLTGTGATAPTIVPSRSWGVASISRSAAGKYVLTFGTSVNGRVNLDVYREFMGLIATAIGTGGADPAVTQVAVIDDSTAVAGTCTLTIQCYGPTGSAADLAASETLCLVPLFSDSSAV